MRHTVTIITKTDRIPAILTNEHANCTYGRVLLVIDGQTHTVEDFFRLLGVAYEGDALLLGACLTPAIEHDSHESRAAMDEWAGEYAHGIQTCATDRHHAEMTARN